LDMIKYSVGVCCVCDNINICNSNVGLLDS
jgi:hypothetical protein